LLLKKREKGSKSKRKKMDKGPNKEKKGKKRKIFMQSSFYLIFKIQKREVIFKYRAL
jgi:hypothetical protein